jgi:hypothetical protein
MILGFLPNRCSQELVEHIAAVVNAAVFRKSRLVQPDKAVSFLVYQVYRFGFGHSNDAIQQSGAASHLRRVAIGLLSIG